MRILLRPSIEIKRFEILIVVRDYWNSRIRAGSAEHQLMRAEGKRNTHEVHSSRARYSKIVLDMQTMNFVLRDAGASPTDRG